MNSLPNTTPFENSFNKSSQEIEKLILDTMCYSGYWDDLNQQFTKRYLDEVHNNISKMSAGSSSADNTLATTSNCSLPSAIQSKDFFHNIVMPAYSPVWKNT